MLIIFALSFFGLLGMFIEDKGKTTLNKEMLKKILHKSTNIFYQIMLLAIIYVEFPLMLALVIIGV
jgi:hypothetical protein